MKVPTHESANWTVTGLLDHLLNIRGVEVYLLVALVVFAEDALIVGFVLPGQTAAVLGGVIASRGHIQLWLILPLVVLAATGGDSIGYVIGRHLGPRILRLRFWAKRRQRLDHAQAFLRRRGGAAVFLARFIACFRTVTPALAGTSGMRYRRFLVYNAAAGIVWGIGFVLVGYFAGSSYRAIATAVGTGAVVAVTAFLIAAFAVWRIRKHRAATAVRPDPRSTPAAQTRQEE